MAATDRRNMGTVIPPYKKQEHGIPKQTVLVSLLLLMISFSIGQMIMFHYMEPVTSSSSLRRQQIPSRFQARKSKQHHQQKQHFPPILANVILSVDYNTYYYRYWPLVKEGWEKLLGVNVWLFLAVHENQFIHNETEFALLQQDPSVRIVYVKPNRSTMQVSQWARLLGAGLVDTPPGGLNILSDMDLLPASARYFYSPLLRLRDVRDEMLIYYRYASHERDKYGISRQLANTVYSRPSRGLAEINERL